MILSVILIGINLITSLITGIIGLGGGIILLALLPFFLPASAIIPIHGMTQLASNASRAWFGRHYLEWQYIPSFLIGSVVGIICFGLLVQRLNLSLIPLFIGIYILLIQWSKQFNRLLQKINNFYLIGFLQTGIGLFVGAPGPLAITLLAKKYDNNHTVITVGAFMMSIVHLAKLPVYLSLGFSFQDYSWLLISMIIVSVIGSWLGVKLRHIFPIHWLKHVLPWLLTILAIKLIMTVLW